MSQDIPQVIAIVKASGEGRIPIKRGQHADAVTLVIVKSLLSVKSYLPADLRP